MTSRRKHKPPRLPPAWVRRADWRWAGGRPFFAFPHLASDEDAEITELHRLWQYAQAHPVIVGTWMARVDQHRRPEPECLCPQCVAAMEGRA